MCPPKSRPKISAWLWWGSCCISVVFFEGLPTDFKLYATFSARSGVNSPWKNSGSKTCKSSVKYKNNNFTHSSDFTVPSCWNSEIVKGGKNQIWQSIFTSHIFKIQGRQRVLFHCHLAKIPDLCWLSSFYFQEGFLWSNEINSIMEKKIIKIPVKKIHKVIQDSSSTLLFVQRFMCLIFFNYFKKDSESLDNFN